MSLIVSRWFGSHCYMFKMVYMHCKSLEVTQTRIQFNVDHDQGNHMEIDAIRSLGLVKRKLKQSQNERTGSLI